MITLKENKPLEMLRQLSVNLLADLIEDFGASKLVLENEKGNGTISLYEVFPGLTAWVYNIKFNSDLSWDFSFAENPNYYFGYHILGHQFIKVGEREDFETIDQGQNFILRGQPNTNATFTIPGGTHYECCYLIVEPSRFNEHPTKIKRQLQDNFNELFSDYGIKRPYKYFGNIDVRIGTYAKIVTKNKRTDVVGRLMVEAAILNMLASQIEAHDYDISTSSFQPELDNHELQVLSKLGDYIQNNISKKLDIKYLSQHFGMSPKKLQSGVRFLFGYSVNRFTTNVRLERAKEFILTGNGSISEICFKVGFNNRSYFSKVFKRRFGLLPSDYIKSVRKENLPFEITYRSLAKTDISESDIENIISTSRNQNKKFGITGCLIYHRKVFFQTIEGNRNELLQLYENIQKDNRHSDIVLIWKGYKGHRDFTGWSMATFTDENILNIPIEGDTRSLNLSHLMGNIESKSLVSKNLWKKVRNHLKSLSYIES